MYFSGLISEVHNIIWLKHGFVLDSHGMLFKNTDSQAPTYLGWSLKMNFQSVFEMVLIHS